MEFYCKSYSYLVYLTQVLNLNPGFMYIELTSLTNTTPVSSYLQKHDIIKEKMQKSYPRKLIYSMSEVHLG